MKKFFLIALVAALFLSCSKNKCDYNECGIVAPSSEVASVQAYLTSNNITATQHCSGIFYAVDNPGSGKQPNGCSTVTVNYEGKLTNGTVFDHTSAGQPATFSLGDLITGFRNGAIQIKTGGKIHVYIPPSLGYGSRASGSIPANSILIFTIELVSVD
ncbi:FKBP-type peptidyl-prolyl cis-trans isomerase [Flavisolibacter ginsenosidimutans]|uniref:Peptidyl-prolyl cis-trans isomerase n=1 Tax=Flavisolibacter ginsenosidimutans TaxID=661481 RepID=A0A5B8UEY0_9BACT|nr:FKBP-type peptidyl-prolyl cis-trans isomerase [Flavisolibacter ginsenosidimutans]QEC55068.1 FKBP-type peptidylprolyl isomerase [Flavisolibacter ginsenosidimutans]